jgi:hypothetical protein
VFGGSRREQGGFPGFDVFQKQMKEGVSRKRVGLATAAPAREHTELQVIFYFYSSDFLQSHLTDRIFFWFNSDC